MKRELSARLTPGVQTLNPGSMKTRRSIPIIISLLAALAMSTSFADQPLMKEALDHPRAARASLEHAEHNKLGHRERAIEHVDKAIAEVEAGMQAAR